MKKRVSFIAVFVLTFIACAKPPGSSNAGNSKEPNSTTLTLDGEKAKEKDVANESFELTEDLRKEALAAHPLTDEDKALVAKLMNSDPKYLANFSIFFIDPKHLDKESAPAQADYARLPDEGKALIDKVRANCKIAPQTTVAGKSDSGLSNLLNMSASISGVACPIIFDNEGTVKTIDSAVDPKTLAQTGVLISKSSETGVVRDQDLAKTLLYVKRESTIRQKAVLKNFVQPVANQPSSGRAHIKSTIVATLTTADGSTQVIHTRIETVHRDGKKQAQAISRATLPNGKKMVIGLFSKDGKMEALVNGQNYPYEKIKQDFGFLISDF